MKTTFMKQHPVGSGFDAFSTAEAVMEGIDLTDKTALVTGGYSGLGLETVRVLHRAGATVIVPTRNLEKTRTVFREYDDRILLEEMDLLDPDAIDRFAAKIIARGRPLHLLVNNAGIMASPLARDRRGYEAQFATNHLGHFQLTARLWPALQQAGGARVIAVSSLGHRFSPVVFDDVSFERRAYDRWAAYGQSKTANILFAVELDRRGASQGIHAFSVHPGRVLDTNLKQYLSQEEMKAMGAFGQDGKQDPVNPLKTIAQGASTIVWCATTPALNNLGGVYCANCDVAEVMNVDPADAERLRNSSGLTGVLPYAIDDDQAARLWQVSEQLTGIRFSASPTPGR